MDKKEAFLFTGQDAENYDHYLGPILFEPYAKYLASQIDATNVKTALEIACGTGRVTRHIRKALPDSVKLQATDISHDMLNVAKRELSNNDIHFSVEDALNLSFTDNSFDLVICQFGLMFFPDKKKGLDEIIRVLKPGGKLMLFTWDDTLNMPLFKLLVYDLVVPHFRDEENTTRFFIPFSLHDPSLLEGLMNNSGFKNIKVNKIALKSGPHLINNIVKGLFSEHPLGKQIMAKAPEEFEPIAKKFKKGILATYDTARPVIDLSAFLTIGEK
jgi:ubiquinone/menaquinone biosynthesis C-methylase UbiE